MFVQNYCHMSAVISADFFSSYLNDLLKICFVFCGFYVATFLWFCDTLNYFNYDLTFQ